MYLWSKLHSSSTGHSIYSTACKLGVHLHPPDSDNSQQIFPVEIVDCLELGDNLAVLRHLSLLKYGERSKIGRAHV